MIGVYDRHGDIDLFLTKADIKSLPDGPLEGDLLNLNNPERRLRIALGAAGPVGKALHLHPDADLLRQLTEKGRASATLDGWRVHLHDQERLDAIHGMVLENARMLQHE